MIENKIRWYSFEEKVPDECACILAYLPHPTGVGCYTQFAVYTSNEFGNVDGACLRTELGNRVYIHNPVDYYWTEIPEPIERK